MMAAWETKGIFVFFSFGTFPGCFPFLLFNKMKLSILYFHSEVIEGFLKKFCRMVEQLWFCRPKEMCPSGRDVLAFMIFSDRKAMLHPVQPVQQQPSF